MELMTELRDEYKLGLIGNIVEKQARSNKMKRDRFENDKALQQHV